MASLYLLGSFTFNSINIVRQSKEGPPPNARPEYKGQGQGAYGTDDIKVTVREVPSSTDQ